MFLTDTLALATRHTRLISDGIVRSASLGLVALSMLIATGCHDNSTPGIVDPTEEDDYLGPTCDFELGPEVDGFTSSSFTLALETPDGSIIKREGKHMRMNSRSRLNLSTGLADGVYRLLYLEYPISENPELNDLADQFSTTQFGLGSRVEVKNGTVTVLDHYDEEIGLPGRGTTDEPYEISSYNSLIKLAQIVNSEDKNSLITADTHFRQTGKIDLYQASREVDRRYGWLPIGANSALPFRGHYHGAALSTMIVDRPNSAAVGLFGYVHNAAIYNVKLSNSAVSGNFGAGGVVGVSLMSGNDRGLITMIGCEVSGCEITGSDQSVSIGGLLGAVDMQSRACLQNCTSSDNTINGSYNAGGLVGGSGLYSSVAFNSCRNTSDVVSEYSGAGGLIGTCDTVQAAASSNSGYIRGATAYNSGDKKNSGIGTGGLVGGTGTATVTSCINSGRISGYAGVGGLVGSARVKGSDTEAYMYNNVMFRYSRNEGEVKGTDCVGGLTGEAQCGTYGVYNKGDVAGTRYVGGIAGATSIAVTHNAINLGKIEGADYVAGIVGKTTFGSLALDHNYGEVDGTGSHLGGITALAGNNTIIHYCGNYGNLKSSGKGPVGGIVGEIGDPREWTAMNTTECIIGGMECAMGIIGPVMAIAGEAIEALSETLEVVLHITEVTTDCGLLIADTALFNIGVAEMIEGEELEQLSSSLSQEVNEINATVKSEMAQLRRNVTIKLESFDQNALKETCPDLVDDLLSYYESEEGAEKFNEQINLAREEREDYLERVHKTNEIIHTVVSGVCIVVGAAATIGGMVATGGAAAPFIVAGAAASLAGGLNAITKTCMEFQENAVIISQCINAGKISSESGSPTGGLVGVLQDNSILRDCLNTGDGPGHGYPFVGRAGNNAPQQRLLSLSNYYTWDVYNEVSFSKGKVLYLEGASDKTVNDLWGRSEVKLLKSHNEVTDPYSYALVDDSWQIKGSSNAWKLATSGSNSFPIPNRSEMKK